MHVCAYPLGLSGLHCVLLVRMHRTKNDNLAKLNYHTPLFADFTLSTEEACTDPKTPKLLEVPRKKLRTLQYNLGVRGPPGFGGSAVGGLRFSMVGLSQLWQ